MDANALLQNPLLSYKVHNALIMYLKVPANQDLGAKIVKAIYKSNGMACF